jgi:hypothetical protein
MDACQVFRKARPFFGGIKTVYAKKFMRPVTEEPRRVENPTSHVSEALPFGEIKLVLLKRLLGALAVLDVEINPDPIQEVSIARPQGFDSAEEPAVPSISVTNSKTDLSYTARAQTCRPHSS